MTFLKHQTYFFSSLHFSSGFPTLVCTETLILVSEYSASVHSLSVQQARLVSIYGPKLLFISFSPVFWLFSKRE